MSKVSGARVRGRRHIQYSPHDVPEYRSAGYLDLLNLRDLVGARRADVKQQHRFAQLYRMFEQPGILLVSIARAAEGPCLRYLKAENVARVVPTRNSRSQLSTSAKLRYF